ADVAIDDPECANRGRGAELTGMAGGCNGCTGHWEPPKATRPPDHPRGAVNCQSATRRRKLPWGLLSLGSPVVLKSRSRKSWSQKFRALWRAVGGNQTRFADHRVGACDVQAGSFKIRP